MNKNRLKLRIIGLIVGLILFTAFGPISIGEETAETELEIHGIEGKIGEVIVAVLNVGDTLLF